MRYFIGFLVTIGLIIILIILLFHGGGKSKVPATAKSLTSYAATDAEVSMTIDGPVNAASEHEQVRVTVNRDNVTYQHIKGYDGQVVDTQIFANTENSYDVFLHALLHAGFTKGDSNKALQDERGYCATGDRYIFELNQDNDNLERYWASSCGSPKTYLGALNLTLTLFQAQVPGYQNLTSGIQL
jgi:hypothetical protein